MGWASGGEIFNVVADGLIKAGASDDIKRSVLSSVCDALQENDWDTEDESLERYKDDPVIVQVFADHDVTTDYWDE